MPYFFVVVFLLVNVGISVAGVYPDPDRIGIYFDTNADMNSMIVGASVPFSAYVVITHPTSGVWGSEFSFCAVVPEGEETFLFKLFEEWPVMCPGPIDTEFQEYCSVGISNECTEEIPQINDVVIVTRFQFMLLKPMCVDFFLGPVVEQSIGDGLPAYVGDGGVVFPLALSTGAGLPVAIVNGGCGTTPLEAITFERVKCLYR